MRSGISSRVGGFEGTFFGVSDFFLKIEEITNKNEEVSDQWSRVRAASFPRHQHPYNSHDDQALAHDQSISRVNNAFINFMQTAANRTSKNR